MLTSVRKDIQEYRVSSVLNNERKLYGKKYIFDGNDETCWNSDKGSPQWIEFSFPSNKSIEQIIIQFQGGFAAKSCSLEAIKCTDNANANRVDAISSGEKIEFYPNDSNTSQTFPLEKPICASKFKLSFISSYDFYGRIIVYNIDIFDK